MKTSSCFVLAFLAVACGSSSSTSGASPTDASVTDAAPSDAAAPPHDAGHDADAATCDGTPPLCFGSNTSMCCGNDPAGDATCENGAWMCGSAPAPGCNGTSCTAGDGG